MTTPRKPASLTFRAPKRLAETFARPGFKVELLITRADHATIDPGADVPPIDAPITDLDRRHFEGHLAAYEVNDLDDDGPKFEAPQE